MIFSQKLNAAIESAESLVCVGLDPDPSLFPSSLPKSTASIADFCEAIIESTHDLVCAYKPNLAFFEQAGAAGMDALHKVLKTIPKTIPVILDGKRGDIGNTSVAYARSLFDELGGDAVTVNPYLGYDGIAPFLEYAAKGVFVLCLTSNPGSRDFQTVPENNPLYKRVAKRVVEWNVNHNCGLVVGATQVSAIEDLRAIAPDLPFLVPGVGAQKGDLRGAIRYGKTKDGKGLLINASRSILYASSGTDYAKQAREATQKLRDDINKHR